MSITEKKIESFGVWLVGEGKSQGTREKYLRDVRKFSQWLHGREPGRETGMEWRESLVAEGLAPVTVNSMLGAVNAFFKFLGVPAGLRYLKVQRSVFREKSRELTQEEFRRLVATAEEQGKNLLALLMETICATGIRVSEVRYITVEAARRGKTNLSLKGKNRQILLPGKLCRKLLKYVKKEKIAFGEIFRTKRGKGITRKQIWAEMKKLCKAAGVEATKVFPHNLRHLFATTFYRLYKDVVRLADVLGHSSIDTTRIYLRTTGAEHQRMLEQMQLVS